MGYQDKEFQATFAWDIDLLSGYTSIFLSRAHQGGADSFEKISARGLRNVLQKVNPTVVLLTGYASIFHQVAFLQVCWSRYPILFRADTADHALKRNWMKTWLRDSALRFFYSRCTKLLYIGRRSHEHFKRLSCPQKKLIFSPYCIDTTVFLYGEKDRLQARSTTRKNLNIPEDERVILFSGKLIPRKAPDLLLASIMQLPAQIRQKIVVIFMGDGELKGELQKRTEQLSIQARFVGFQNQTALSRYYHAADLFVLPSRSEVWGIVVNEALHHGVPCIVSDSVGSAPDLIEPGITGEIFETDSPESLILAIQRAFSLVGRLEIREKCRKKVQDYTIERAVEGIARAYNEVVQDYGR